MKSLVIVATLFAAAYAHSNVGQPLAYNAIACKASVSWCKGSCPPLWKGKTRNTPQKPAAVWKRGQTVEIIYHKNNHVGGFYRRSLVPVKYMFDEKWHKKTAFDFGCWQQGTFQCGKNAVCGADLKGRAYKNKIKIPAVFPDGNYVFAQVWYGGLHWQGGYSKYSDYFACSFVKIQGGDKLVSQHTATFTGPKKTCRTGKTFPLDCGGDGCNLKNGKPRPAFTGVPVEFANGKKPVVFSSTLGVTGMKETNMKMSDSTSAQKAQQDQKKDAKADNEAGKEETKYEAKAQKPVSAKPPPKIKKPATVVQKPKPVNVVKVGNSDYSGPVKSLYVLVGGKNVYALKDKGEIEVTTYGQPVRFVANTGGKNVGKLYFKVPNKPAILQGSLKYVFAGKWLENKKFPIMITHYAKNSKTEFKAEITLYS